MDIKEILDNFGMNPELIDSNEAERTDTYISRCPFKRKKHMIEFYIERNEAGMPIKERFHCEECGFTNQCVNTITDVIMGLSSEEEDEYRGAMTGSELAKKYNDRRITRKEWEAASRKKIREMSHRNTVNAIKNQIDTAAFLDAIDDKLWCKKKMVVTVNGKTVY